MSVHFLTRLFDVAARFPDNVAIDEGADRCTNYAAFASRVRRLAHEFSTLANAPRVLIYMPKQADAYAAMFATVMAGGFYTPVNAGISPQRLNHVMNTLAPDIIFTNRDFWREKVQALPQQPETAAVLFAEDLPAQGGELSEPLPAHRLAYAMFTSGSTGLPKGVMISQHALSCFTDWLVNGLKIQPQDRVSQHPNIGFDLSVMDIYGALCTGATLVVINSELERLFPARAISERRISVWHSVPSIISLMQRAGQVDAQHLASLRQCVFIGEALLPEQLDAMFAARPDLLIYNAYGPTEATVACTAVPLTAQNYRQYCRHNVAIGEPFGENRLYLVGGDTPDEGELVIAGPQLADGYMKDEEKTAAAFRPLPEHGEERAYFTGDWMRREGGNLYFVSRIDFQVKIKGHRLELGEVDAALRREGLTSVATIADGDRLISFVEGRPEALNDPAALRRRLRRHLEEYAIPAGFIVVDKLPRNANDKIDVKELARRFREGEYAGQEML